MKTLLAELSIKAKGILMSGICYYTLWYHCWNTAKYIKTMAGSRLLCGSNQDAPFTLSYCSSMRSSLQYMWYSVVLNILSIYHGALKQWSYRKIHAGSNVKKGAAFISWQIFIYIKQEICDEVKERNRRLYYHNWISQNQGDKKEMGHFTMMF